MIATWVLLGILAMLYSGGHRSSRRRDPPPATTTTWNKEVRWVGMHEGEHVEGARCGPEHRDGWVSNQTLGMGQAYCGDGWGLYGL